MIFKILKYLKKYSRFRIAVLGANGQILGHFATLNRVNADLLQRRAKLLQRGILVQFGAVSQAPRPGEDWGLKFVLKIF